MDNPLAIESATEMLGVRSQRSTNEIIFEDNSDFSAKDSCDIFASVRYRRRTAEKQRAKSLVATVQSCQAAERLF
jgi:hypothetical protein